MPSFILSQSTSFYIFEKGEKSSYRNVTLQKSTALTSWKRDDISHTRQELGLCISHLCRSERKKSRRSGVWVSAWTMQFMKHVFPRLISPRRPGKEEDRRVGVTWALTYRYYWTFTLVPLHLCVHFLLFIHSRRARKNIIIFLFI